MPSLPSPEPTVNYFDDLDFFKDFENEFPAIVYNDALTSKSDSSTEPVKIPHRIAEFDLKTETSLSEYDEEKQNVVYFNDLFLFNIIYPDDLESDKDNDDNEIDIIHSSEGDVLNINVKDFKERLGRIYGREIQRVYVFDFRRLIDLMVEGLSGRMLIKHKDVQGQTVFTRQAWRKLFKIRGPLVHELILEFFSTYMFRDGVLDLDTARVLQFQLGGAESLRQIPDKGDLSAYWVGISSVVDFLGTAPSYTLIRDPMLRLCHGLIVCSIAGRSQAPKKVTVTDLFYLRGMDVGSVNTPYMLARYMRLFALGRKRGVMISGGQFVARLAEHFRLLTEERLQGLTELHDTWAWVALGPESQPDVAVGVLVDAEGAPDVVEGDQAVLAPVQGPQPPPARTMAQRLARVEEEVHEIRGELGEQREVMDVMARDLSRFTVWAAGGPRCKEIDNVGEVSKI
ncbi:hypothetical protein Tco_1539809 [Tanacetum coccineum]